MVRFFELALLYTLGGFDISAGLEKRSAENLKDKKSIFNMTVTQEENFTKPCPEREPGDSPKRYLMLSLFNSL